MINFYHQLDHKPMDADFLEKRKRCCKSACLHCPYGFTTKKYGILFCRPDEVKEEDLNILFEELGRSYAEYDLEHTKLIILKEVIIGFMVHNHIIVKEMHLLKAFQNQSISRELVESYFFY